MSRKPEDIKDWEKVLREGSFDLPEATWQRMENDMRGFLAAQAREAAQPKAATLAQRLKSWFVLPSVRWGVGLASLGLIALAIVSPTSIMGTSERFAWVPGQAIEAHGRGDWAWSEGRCRIQGLDSRLLLKKADASSIEIELERGSATFQVEHRKPDESFSVKVGDCQVHVVGTTFTVGIDSLKQWVAVEEGKIRFESLRGQRLVSKGQSGTCRELGAGVVASLADTLPTVAVAVAENATSGLKTVPGKKEATNEVVVPSCTTGEDCITELSSFVRTQPAHAAVGEIAMRWGRLASARGDYRDALVAYGFAGRQSQFRTNATLEVFQTQIRGLGLTNTVRDSLDRWIDALAEGTATWREALTLRKEIARNTGDGETVKRVEARLQSGARAESGGR